MRPSASRRWLDSPSVETLLNVLERNGVVTTATGLNGISRLPAHRCKPAKNATSARMAPTLAVHSYTERH